MPIYRLNPIDADYNGWRYSTYQGEVIVQAANESDARNQADLQFSIMAEVDLAEEQGASPWTQKAIVSCEIDENILTTKSSESGIVSPVQ